MEKVAIGQVNGTERKAEENHIKWTSLNEDGKLR